MSLKTLRINHPLTKIFTKPVVTATLEKGTQSILDFRNKPQESLSNIITRCDREVGGFSNVKFDYNERFKYGQFSGYLNLDLPKDHPESTRSGYALFRTNDQKESWLSGNSYWDWTQYDNLVLRVRGDARKYFVNIQANTPLITDLFQYRLYLNTPGQWETLVIPLSDFFMTNWGLVQDGIEMNRAEIKTVGIGLVDKQYGPFKLDIEWIKVMSDSDLMTESSINFQAQDLLD